MSSPLLSLAQSTIDEALGIATMPSLSGLLDTHPSLKIKGATFVTLTQSGALRGCIGTLEAYRPLYEDIISNARAAAFEYPRFTPLTKEEWANTTLELSLLTPPKPVAYDDIAALKAAITPFKDGVILQHGSRKATFLPQVWEQLPSFEEFFRHLCQKAGLGPECLARHPSILTYQVEKITA
jgi:AmmeMemoRadiSam system protein A